MGALAELIKLGIKTAAKQADEVVPRVVSQIDDLVDKRLLNKIETRKGIDLEYGDIGESLDKARKLNILADKQIKKYNIDPDFFINYNCSTFY